MGGRVSGRTWNKKIIILVLLTRIGSVAAYTLLMGPSTLNTSVTTISIQINAYKAQFLLQKVCIQCLKYPHTYTGMIHWIMFIAVDSLTHTLHNQVTYNVQKYLTLRNTYNNSPCSVMIKLPYTGLYSMIVQLPYASTYMLWQTRHMLYTAIAATHLPQLTLPYTRNDE